MNPKSITRTCLFHQSNRPPVLAILGLLIALLVTACQPVPMPLAPMQATQQTTSPRPDRPAFAASGPLAVGYRTLNSQGGDYPLTISIWYPATLAEGEVGGIVYPAVFKDPTWQPETPLEVYGQAVADAPVDSNGGPYPLVVFSHGYIMSPTMYSGLAEHYASHGFVVMAPDHVEQFDPTFQTMWTPFIDRPKDVSRTLDVAEDLNGMDGELAGLIDMDGVAVVGHSYGGYTALAAAGAQYDMTAYGARCAELAQDDPLIFFCMPILPNAGAMAERAGIEREPDGLWPSFGDPRVTAILPMAGDSYLFDQAGLAQITVPMMAIGGSGDTWTPMAWGSMPTFEHASSAEKTLVTLEGAGHMVFNTPCALQPGMYEHPAAGEICFDAVWDKERAFDLIRHFSTAFLLETLTGTPEARAALITESVSFPGVAYTTTLE